MLTEEMRAIIEAGRPQGWVLEPEAKRLLALTGIPVPRHVWAREEAAAVSAGAAIGYPVAVKVVSPAIVHKSDVGGVVLGLNSAGELRDAFLGLSALQGFQGVLVEEMVAGAELILGAKDDYQFGPVVLLGMGGTAVEIYRDTALRMPPLTGADVMSMIRGLKAERLLEGYRGGEPIDFAALSDLVVRFARLAMDLEGLAASMDLNPLLCSARGCLAADARIMLAGKG